MLRIRALIIFTSLSAVFGLYFKAAADGMVGPSGSKAHVASSSRLAEKARSISVKIGNRGFHIPYVVMPGGPTTYRLFVAPYGGHVISLWFATEQGAIAIELFHPTGQLLASWKKPRGEWSFEHKLAPFQSGTYVISVQALGGAHVHGVIGIKGPVVDRCAIDNDRLMPQPADPPRYWWPYLLVKPITDARVSARPGTLFVVPNNTGFESEDGELLRASAICELHFGESIGPLAVADSLGEPLLIPLLPRPEQLYLQALTRASLREDLAERFYRVDKQLIAMIDDARAKLLREMHRPIQDRVLMAGFSASGVFTNRFALLHPERLLAAAIGGPGGWPIAPVSADQGRQLPYPVGIEDLGTKELGGKPMDLAALQRVRFLFLLGDADTNDAVPCRDSFSDSDARLINNLFGTVSLKCGEGTETLVKRWWHARRLYDAAGLNARFRLYPNVGHEMGMTPIMWNDVVDMFKEELDHR